MQIIFLKTWQIISLRLNAQILKMAYEALYGLVPCHLTDHTI